VTAVSQIFTIAPKPDPAGRFASPPAIAWNVLGELRQHPERVEAGRELSTECWVSPVEEPPDFLRGLDAARVVSERVKAVVSAYDVTEVAWIPVGVVTPSARTSQYWLVHYPRLREVFDLETTTFGPSGLPIRWVIDLEQVQELPVFMVPGPLAETFLVHAEVKDALLAAGVTGMDVRRTRT